MIIDLLSTYIDSIFTGINAIWMGSNIYNFYPLLKVRKLEKPEPVEVKEKPKISVLLPAYKEEKVLLNTVKRIESNSYSNLELILMTEKDDSKTDRMAEYLHRKYGNVVHVPVEDNGKTRGKPRALNQGLSKATGGIIGVLDAEDYISDDLFNVAAWYIKEKGYDAVQGELKLKPQKGSWLDKQFQAEYEFFFGEYLPRLSRLDFILPFGGTTNFFKKEILNELGGWEEENLTEDYELAMRANMYSSRTGKKYRIGMMDIVTMEQTTPNLKSWIRQRTRWQQGKIQTTVEYSKQKYSLKDKTKMYMSGFGAFFGPINFTGIGMTAVYYLDHLSVPEIIKPIVYFNLLSATFYCYLQGRSYEKIARKENRNHPYLDGFFIGITTPAYWVLQWAASTRAVFREIKNKKNWEKTEHTPIDYSKKD